MTKLEEAIERAVGQYTTTWLTGEIEGKDLCGILRKNFAPLFAEQKQRIKELEQQREMECHRCAGGCNLKYHVSAMFRCHECLLYFCPDCAKEHFPKNEILKAQERIKDLEHVCDSRGRIIAELRAVAEELGKMLEKSIAILGGIRAEHCEQYGWFIADHMDAEAALAKLAAMTAQEEKGKGKKEPEPLISRECHEGAHQSCEGTIPELGIDADCKCECHEEDGES